MAIPYNPSSFATNKTILQAIEELKNYLKDNPCYKVYYVNTVYVVGTTTYNLSDVDDPDDTMTAGDIVFFNNSYYASVINKDTNTFDIDPAVSFKGATGQAGADGQDGVSVVGATINASNHLIITLSDGNTIDAGEILSNFEIIEISNLYISGTITADEYTKLKGDSVIVKRGEYYFRKNRLYSSEQHVIYEVCTNANTTTTWIMSVDFTDSYTWSLSTNVLKTKIQSSDIDSQTATSGQVLTADGNGSASWTTVSAGGYDNTVSITATSGTFSDSDFAKLGYGDSTIVYTDAYSVSTVYKLKIETASILEFESIDATSKNNLKLIDVNKTTKAYSSTSISMIKSATFDSGTATSGKVLTANGSGGTSWETVSAGSVEGTTILSTGETSGKVLTANGSGGASWQTAGGGGGLNKYSFTPSSAYQLCQVLLNAKYSKVVLTNLKVEFDFILNGSTLIFNACKCDSTDARIYSFNILDANLPSPTIVTGNYWSMTTSGNTTGAVSSVQTLSNWSIEYLNETQLH